MMGAPKNTRGKEIYVDQRCWNLAKIFLPNEADPVVADLAEVIQDACEFAVSEAEKVEAPARWKPSHP